METEEEASTASATSPTPFWERSSRSSPPRKAHAPKPPRPGGATWRSAPLNLDLLDFDVDKVDELNAVVSRILSTRTGPGRRLCVPNSSWSDRLTTPTLDAWLVCPALNNLQELDLFYSLPPLSAFVFRFSPTLRVATFELCHLPDSTVQGLHFPQLKQLGLEGVRISECSLHNMIAGCPALECLLINRSFGFRCLRINSLTLRSVGVHVAVGVPVDCVVLDVDSHELLLEELVIEIESAPCLERLLHQDQGWGRDLLVSVILAPKLETLGFLYDQTDQSIFVFGSTVIQGLKVQNLTAVVRTVKILAVKMDSLSLDTIIDLMRCFPCLEKLYIQSSADASGEKNLWRRKHWIRSLDICLKTVVLDNYSGTKSLVNFATFFVLNARVLESMTLQVEDSNGHSIGYGLMALQAEECDADFLAEQQRKLLLEKSASRVARLNFTTYKCFRDFDNITHGSALDVADPFAW